MQDLNKIPNPDVNTPDVDINDGRRSDIEQTDKKDEPIPVPPDSQPVVPIEDPPDARDKPPVDENEDGPKKIV